MTKKKYKTKYLVHNMWMMHNDMRYFVKRTLNNWTIEWTLGTTQNQQLGDKKQVCTLFVYKDKPFPFDVNC